MTLEIYKSTSRTTKGQFGYRIYSSGRITDGSTELYKRKATMMRTLENGMLYAWVKIEVCGKRIYISPPGKQPVKRISIRDLTLNKAK